MVWLLFASGRIGRGLKMAIVIAPVVIAGYVAGLPYGPKGVAFGYSAAMVLLTIPMIGWAIRGTNLTPTDIIRAVVPPIVSVAVAAVLALTTARLLGADAQPFTRLMAGGSVLVVSYALMLLVVMRRKGSYVDLIRDCHYAVIGRGNKGGETRPVSPVIAALPDELS
jgi:PST family polysaccharide transporter